MRKMYTHTQSSQNGEPVSASTILPEGQASATDFTVTALAGDNNTILTFDLSESMPFHTFRGEDRRSLTGVQECDRFAPSVHHARLDRGGVHLSGNKHMP